MVKTVLWVVQSVKSLTPTSIVDNINSCRQTGPWPALSTNLFINPHYLPPASCLGPRQKLEMPMKAWLQCQCTGLEVTRWCWLVLWGQPLRWCQVQLLIVLQLKYSFYSLAGLGAGGPPSWPDWLQSHRSLGRANMTSWHRVWANI